VFRVSIWGAKLPRGDGTVSTHLVLIQGIV